MKKKYPAAFPSAASDCSYLGICLCCTECGNGLCAAFYLYCCPLTDRGGSYCFRLFLSGRRKPAGLLRKNPLPGNRHCPEASSAVFCCVSHRICSRSAYNIRPLEKAGLSQQCTSCLFRYSVYFFTRKPVSACGSLWHLLYADCIFYV